LDIDLLEGSEVDHFLKELSLYDLTGYLLPGVVAVWSVLAVHEALRRKRNSPRLVLSIWVFLVVAYLAGHLVQTVASKFFRLFPRAPISSLYASESVFQQRLEAEILNRFGVQPDKKKLDLCETYLRLHGIDGYAEIMKARHAFFRGLTVSFLMALLAFVYKAGVERDKQADAMPERQRNSMLLAAVLVVAMILSLLRLREFDGYYTDAVYRTFYERCIVEARAAGMATPRP
jgi:hypothetical protein